jgi:hypothetical protein
LAGLHEALQKNAKTKTTWTPTRPTSKNVW